MNKTGSFCVIALLLLASNTLSSQLTTAELAEVKTSTHSLADSAGITISTILKVFHLIAFLMLLLDVKARYNGTPLNYAHALRFIFFIYGSCCPWLLGGNENYAPAGYRGFNDNIFFHYFDLIYHGYFGFGYINCFNHNLKVDGQEYGFLYINILFFEILAFFILKTMAWAVSDELEENNRWSNFLASLKGMVFEFFAFPYCGWGVFFFKQHFVLSDLEDDGSVVTGRNDVVYWFSMLLALWMNYEVAMSCFELLMGNKDCLNNLSEEDLRVTHGRSKMLAPEAKLGQNIDSSGGCSDRSPVNCTTDALYEDYFLMVQHHFRSVHTNLSKFYNTIWIMRWVVFAVFSIIWYKYPRTLYLLFLVINLAMIGITVVIKKSFRWGFAFKLILVEEILVTLWHLAALVNYLDYYGSRGMSQFVIGLNTHIMFWSFLLTAAIEIALLVAGAVKNQEYFASFP